jgi:hypothetical protein
MRPEKAEQELAEIIAQLGVSDGVPHVSRIDLFVDFVWTGSMEWDRTAWITRASSIDTYSESGLFTGWVVGKGGHILARLYLKSLQAAKIAIDYLPPLWKHAGRIEGEPVWRLEFQIKREVLAQMKLARLYDTLRHLNGLWCYATNDWLRLAIPTLDDKTRSRWPIHPLWGYLSSIDWEAPGGPVLRSFSASRTPDDKRLFAMSLAAVTSYAAKHGYRDLYEAYEALIAAVVTYYADKAHWEGLSFDDYIEDRIALKVRQFNASVNDPAILDKLDEAEIERRAIAYRKASRGG